MPAPISLQRPLPAHLAPPPARAPETDQDRRARHLDLTRELTELNMLAARDATHRIVTRPPAEPPQPGDNPTLDLVRATRAVAQVLNLENRLVTGERAAEPEAEPEAEDPRALELRQLLHPLLAHDPDPVRRRAKKLRLNTSITEALADEVDDDLPLATIAGRIARQNGLNFQIAKVADRFLYRPSAQPPDNPFQQFRPEPPKSEPGDGSG